MDNSKGTSSISHLMYSGMHPLLPPTAPFPNFYQEYADFMPDPSFGANSVQKHRKGNTLHQRTLSESFVMEEQPSWLDDLLNEPETPVRRGGHRRSSSDSSFAYFNTASFSNVSYADRDESKFGNLVPIRSWSSQDLHHGNDAYHIPMSSEMNSTKLTHRVWDSCLNPSPSSKENASVQGPVFPCRPWEADRVPSITNEKHDSVESSARDASLSSKTKDGSNAKSSASETDTKHAKQQFAQRSRVRKLQYIAELERNVQGLQVEGSEVSAELDFLNQQNLILSMENKALKQRLESLEHEQLIKYLEQELLEREIGRLRAMYQQQQQSPPPQPSECHRRTNSRDLVSQFANLSLKQRDTNSGHDPMTGPLRI